MGRKPVFGLVGACLTSVAFMGCCDNCSLWDKSPKKDTTVTSAGVRTNGSDNGWRQQPAVGSQGGGTSSGTTVGSSGGAGTSGGSNFTAGGNSPYPVGSGALDRGSSVGTSGTDMNSGRSTQPVNFKDPGSVSPPVRPGASTLPPIPQGSVALPRTDDLTTGKSVRTPVIDPPAPPSSGTVPAPSTSGAGLPAVPAVSGTPATADGLPPIPTPTSQQGLDRGPLPPPAPPPVSGSGVPTLPQSPATMHD